MSGRDRAARVLIATRLFLPEVSAGAFRLGALARGLVRRGADVVVVTTLPPAQAPAVADPPGVRVSRWPVLRDRGGNVRGYLQYASFDVPLLLRVLFRRWDVAVAESPPTTAIIIRIAAWLRRRPYAYFAADVWTDGVVAMGAPRPVVSIMRWLETAVLRRASCVLSVSDEVTARVVALGADENRVVTVGNGIDTAVFSADAAPAVADGDYFVYTGTMSEWQQPDIFLRAFALVAPEHPGLRLRFFGQGSMESGLRGLAASLHLSGVEFGGVVEPSESAAWIRGAVASLVSIVPDIGYDFARPTKTFAAAACGTPVLFAGASVGGSLVRDAGLGEAVGFSVTDVADAMRRLLLAHSDGRSEALRHRRAAWARETASLDAVGRRAADGVLDVLAARRG